MTAISPTVYVDPATFIVAALRCIGILLDEASNVLIVRLVVSSLEFIARESQWPILLVRALSTCRLAGFVGLFNFLLIWPGLIILHLSNWETLEMPSVKVVLYLALNGIIGTVISEFLWLWWVLTNWVSQEHLHWNHCERSPGDHAKHLCLF